MGKCINFGLTLSMAMFLPSAAWGACTVPNTISNGQVADATAVMGNFEAIADCVDTLTSDAVTHSGTPTTGEIAVFTGAQSVTGGDLTGDVTTSGTTATTLSSTGVTPGTYLIASVTVDEKGRITAASSGTGSGSAAGSVFPGSPSVSDRFFRTDRGIEYFWDGTRWLSMQQFTVPLSWEAAISSDLETFSAIPWAGVYGIYLERFEASTYRLASGEWDLSLQWRPQNNTGNNNIATLDGAGMTAAVWNRQAVTINAVLDPDAYIFRILYDEVSGSTVYYAGSLLTYRLVG